LIDLISFFLNEDKEYWNDSFAIRDNTIMVLYRMPSLPYGREPNMKTFDPLFKNRTIKTKLQEDTEPYGMPSFPHGQETFPLDPFEINFGIADKCYTGCHRFPEDKG